MKVVIAVCVLVVATAALARPGEDLYTDMYDNVNIDEVLENKRLLIKYFDCIMDVGKCPPDAKELKAHLKEALENECAKCSEKHKEGARKVIKHLINNEPEIWKKLCGKYDPDMKFTQKYEKELKEL